MPAPPKTTHVCPSKISFIFKKTATPLQDFYGVGFFENMLLLLEVENINWRLYWHLHVYNMPVMVWTNWIRLFCMLWLHLRHTIIVGQCIKYVPNGCGSFSLMLWAVKQPSANMNQWQPAFKRSRYLSPLLYPVCCFCDLCDHLLLCISRSRIMCQSFCLIRFRIWSRNAPEYSEFSVQRLSKVNFGIHALGSSARFVG